MKKYSFIIIIITALISIQAINVNKERLFEIAKNIEIFTNVYKELNTNYVDDLDPSELMRTGIDAMVYSLDPYTRYISESQIESFRISTQGKYSGIGAVIRQVDSVLTVIEAYKDSPSIRAGLIPGDQIIKVNGELTAGKKADDMRNVLRGAPGTDFEMEVQRYGENKLRKVVLTRSEVNIPNVPHYEIMDEDIAYVHLSKFTRDAGQNIRNALNEMKKEKDLNGVIIDLRYNGGGLLREAIAITNLFVAKGKEVVSTKGKVVERDRSYKTMVAPWDTTINVVILINGRSASASEIVSGAIQDFDRGLLVGQRSFGKGLVQNTMQVGYNSQVKLTTSKYYIPSGRCIQSVAYNEGEPIHIPDEERNVFKTKKGREVLDGGGVKPDILIENKKNPEFVDFLLKKNLIFKYVNKFYAETDSIVDVSVFEFEDLDDFKSFYKESGIPFKSDLMNKFEEFEKLIDDSKEHNLTEDLLNNMEAGLNMDEEDMFVKYESEIKGAIEKEIIGRYFYTKGKIRHSLINDKELEKALYLLNHSDEYNSLLSAGK